MKGTVNPLMWMVPRMIWFLESVGLGFSCLVLVMIGMISVRFPVMMWSDLAVSMKSGL